MEVRTTGALIAIEGCDGSGKTEAVKAIKEYCEKENIDFITTREPGGCNISEQIRNIIVDKNNKNMTAQTEALLFAAARTQHINDTILPAVKEGKIVITDRFISSSYAYQAYGRGLGMDYIYNINPKAAIPDLVIYLDVDPEVGLSRIKNNNRDTNRLDEEKLEFYTKCRMGFKEVADQFNTVIIDANKDIDTVKRNVTHAVKHFLKHDDWFDEICREIKNTYQNIAVTEKPYYEIEVDLKP